MLVHGFCACVYVCSLIFDRGDSFHLRFLDEEAEGEERERNEVRFNHAFVRR